MLRPRGRFNNLHHDRLQQRRLHGLCRRAEHRCVRERIWELWEWRKRGWKGALVQTLRLCGVHDHVVPIGILPACASQSARPLQQPFVKSQVSTVLRCHQLCVRPSVHGASVASVRLLARGTGVSVRFLSRWRVWWGGEPLLALARRKAKQKVLGSAAFMPGCGGVWAQSTAPVVAEAENRRKPTYNDSAETDDWAARLDRRLSACLLRRRPPRGFDFAALTLQGKEPACNLEMNYEGNATVGARWRRFGFCCRRL